MDTPGLFTFAWTAPPPHHWILPILVAGAPFGAGFVVVFLAATAYLTDLYGPRHAASALAAAALLRSVFGAVFPLFARAMFARLGVGWGMSLLGFVAAGLAVVPAGLFWGGGRWLRGRGRRGGGGEGGEV